MAVVHGIQIVEDLEKAFQACLASISNPDHFNARESDEIRTSVDMTTQRYLDISKQMDCFFIQKRLLLSVQKPEHLLVESIQELTNEIIRKDALIEKYNEKIQTWQNLLQQDIPGTPRPPPPGQQVPGGPPQNIPPSMPPMQGPQAQMQPQVSAQMPPGGGPGPGHPHHMMHPHAMSPMNASPVPMQPGMVQMQHPPQGMGAAQQGGQLQGPLAYLERTMSNIGMPDPSGR